MDLFQPKEPAVFWYATLDGSITLIYLADPGGHFLSCMMHVGPNKKFNCPTLSASEFLLASRDTWMSQEVSKWLVSGL